ncbi:MAG: hypothetical protein QJR07_20900, partial [Acetobacteraceae bacterium]|nr:hypothetical protein [Acetobacteraceae bacterium]
MEPFTIKTRAHMAEMVMRLQQAGAAHHVPLLRAAMAGALRFAARNPAPLVLRNETVPQRLPPGGLVVLRDGETAEETPLLSPLAWAVEHRAEVEVSVAGATPAARAALLDALLAAIAAAIAADRTLGGAVEWAQPGSPG